MCPLPKRVFWHIISRKQGTITLDDVGDTIFGGRKKIAPFDQSIFFTISI